MYSVLQQKRIELGLALFAVTMTGAGWGQATTPVDRQFAAYDQSLRGSVDDLLTKTAQSPNLAVQAKTDAVEAPANADGKFSSAVRRVQQLRPLLEPILREEGVPTDIAAIVLVESGGHPAALSPKGARGLWQLMPDTARRYGLAVSPEADERIDPARSTRAAARYLRNLYVQLGDWELAFAAYNAGEQAVQRAIMRSGSRDYRHLHDLLPNETRAYVPAVMTARLLFGSKPIRESVFQAVSRARVLYASTRLDGRDLSQE